MPPMSPNSMSQSLFSSQKSNIDFLTEPKKDDKISKDSKTFFKHIHAINYDLIEKSGRITLILITYIQKSDPFKKTEEPTSAVKSKITVDL